LDIHDTDLVVHDLGGPVGMFWAVRHPGRVKNIVVLNTLVYPETSWAVKLFLLALRTPGLRDFLVSPKGLVGAMQFGVVHKDRLNREVLTPYTAPFESPAARQALIKAGSGLSHPSKSAPASARTLRNPALPRRRQPDQNKQTAPPSPHEPAHATQATHTSDARRPASSSHPPR
ncbi:MAG: hypothetical protein JRG70_18675, partial [Deltaproteobacteria bacterium]|nr:hypothetical protein [Deltaproteobacteria bacterium]